jgi:hypothetical protein
LILLTKRLAYTDTRFTPILEEILNSTNDWVRPCVDGVFCLEDGVKAHEYIDARMNVGKVILVPTRAEADEWNKNYKTTKTNL